MDLTALFASDVYTWMIIPLLIFVARILDVSIGTIRVIFIARGFRLLAPLLGFFEVIIWLLAMRQILVNMNNVFCYLAYGAGFAAGTYAGIVLEDKLSVGKISIRVITNKDASKLVTELNKEGVVETVSRGKGPDGHVNIIFVVIDRQDTQEVIDIIKKSHPSAFYSIEDVRFVSGKVYPRNGGKYKNIFGFYRKGK